MANRSASTPPASATRSLSSAGGESWSVKQLIVWPRSACRVSDFVAAALAGKLRLLPQRRQQRFQLRLIRLQGNLHEQFWIVASEPGQGQRSCAATRRLLLLDQFGQGRFSQLPAGSNPATSRSSDRVDVSAIQPAAT